MYTCTKNQNLFLYFWYSAFKKKPTGIFLINRVSMFNIYIVIKSIRNT